MHWMGFYYEGHMSFGFPEGWGSMQVNNNVVLEGIFRTSIFVGGKMIVRDDAQRVRQV